MAQIVTNKAISTRCNLVAIQTGGSKANTVLASGEIWLVDTTNANKGTNGVGLYDSYITGDGTTAAKNLTVRKIDTGTDDSKDIDFRANAGECEENVITVNDSVKECLIAIDDDLGDVHNTLGQVDEELGTKANQATTLAGYGITDAHISNNVVTLGNNSVPVKLDFDEGDTGTNVDLSTSYVTYAPQSMTSAQKAQARENIGAIGASEVATDIAGCVKTTTDQTISGQKTFDNGIIVNASPIDSDIKGNIKVQGTLKYTKPNAGQTNVQSGVLMRDNVGNVYSTQEIPASTRAANADNALQAQQAYKDGQGNVITTTYATKSELPQVISDLTNDEGYITSSDIAGKADKNAALSSLSLTESGGTYTLTGTKADGTSVSIGTINIATVTASGSYDSVDQEIDLTIGSDTIHIPVGDLVSGLQSEITSANKLSASLVSGLATVATTGDYADLSNKLVIDNTTAASGKLYDSTKIDSTYAKKAVSLSGYGITDAVITTNSNTGQKTVTLGSDTVTPAVIDDTLSSSQYKAWSITKMNNTFASLSSVSQLANEVESLDYGVNVSSMFDNAPTLPIGYSLSQLKDKILYTMVNNIRVPVTLKNTYQDNWVVYYIDYNGTSLSPVSSGFTDTAPFTISGYLQDIYDNPLKGETITFTPTNGGSAVQVVTSTAKTGEGGGSYSASLHTGTGYLVTTSQGTPSPSFLGYLTTGNKTGVNLTV